jgi:deazaflavin-dependent oxidoreductase (nitroreductase family)
MRCAPLTTRRGIGGAFRIGQEPRSVRELDAPSVKVMDTDVTDRSKTMTQGRQAGTDTSSVNGGGHGAVSRWMQHRMNARMNRKVRGGRATFMGMDVLILHTVGRQSGQPRQTPVAWFPDGDDAWLVVASGGKNRHPDWHLNLMRHPDRASIELPGRTDTPVTPHVLDGAERELAWKRIAAAQPRLEKYQRKTDREYPVVRLAVR